MGKAIKISIISKLGLPEKFGYTLLLLSLGLFLAPYFSGVDFGVVKVPALNESLSGFLLIGGPVLLLFTICLHVPVLLKPEDRYREHSKIIEYLMRLQDSFIAYSLEPPTASYEEYANAEKAVKNLLFEKKLKLSNEQYNEIEDVIKHIRDFTLSYNKLVETIGAPERPSSESLIRLRDTIGERIEKIRKNLNKQR